MKILVVAPHMDDEVLGCGGTMVRHVLNDDHVTVCVVANRAYDHVYNEELIQREKKACLRAKAILGYQEIVFLDLPDERLDACQIEIIAPLEDVLGNSRPDIVYLPHRGDLNQDHRAVFTAVRVACRPFAPHRVRTMRVFEVPSSTDQAGAIDEWAFGPSFFVDITETLEQKIRAMGCYEVEGRSFPNPRSPEGLSVHAKKRGMEANMRAAEAFMVLRDGW